MQISDQLASSLDYERTLRSVVSLLVSQFGGYCQIDVVGDDDELRRVAGSHADAAKRELLTEESLTLVSDLRDAGPTPVRVAEVLRTGQPHVIWSVREEWRAESLRDPRRRRLVRLLDPHALMFVPLWANGRSHGLLTFVSSERGKTFGAGEVSLAEKVAHQCARAVQNGRLYRAARKHEDALQRRAERDAVQDAVARHFAEAAPGLGGVLDAVGEEVVRLLGERCIILLLSDDGQWLIPGGVYGASPTGRVERLSESAPSVRVTEGLSGRVVRTGQSLLMPVTVRRERADVEWHGRAEGASGAGEQKRVHSLLIAPLRAHQRVFGALSVSRDEGGRPYSAADQRLLHELADRAAPAIDTAQRYAEAQSAIRVRDEVLGASSHDLKGPLTAIKGQVQLAQSRAATFRGGEAERLRTALTRIDTAADRMARLIDELLDVARENAGHEPSAARWPTDLTAVVRQVAAECADSTDRHQILVDAPGAPVTGWWVEARLRRVFENLLGNAIKYSPAGGPISVQLRVRMPGAEEAEPGAGPEEGPWAEVSVRDAGLGIPPQDLPLIFEEFRRGGNAEAIRGTGIGLAVVRRIVEQHGGSVGVDSRMGEGSTFTVRLPMGRRPPAIPLRNRAPYPPAGDTDPLDEPDSLEADSADLL